MSAVWKYAPVDQGELLVLLALADFANDEGRCFPSVETLAEKSRMSERSVQRAVRAMEEAGFLSIEPGGGRHSANQYVIDVDALRAISATKTDPVQPPTEPENTPSDPELRGDNLTPLNPSGVTSTTFRGDTGVTLTVKEETSKEERERAGASAQAGEPPEAPGPTQRGSGKEAFKAAHARWPSYTTDSTPEAERNWFGLEPRERIAAAEAIDRYVEAGKAEGRKATCAFATYLREKRWEKLPPITDAPAARTAPPFGPDWMAIRLAFLLEGPGAMPPPSAFVASIIAGGGERGERERLAYQARAGFRRVRAMDEAAARRCGAAKPREFAPYGAMEPVPVGSATWQAWKAHHDASGWPWLPDPGRMEVVFFPAGGPGALGTFVDYVSREKPRWAS